MPSARCGCGGNAPGAHVAAEASPLSVAAAPTPCSGPLTAPAPPLPPLPCPPPLCAGEYKAALQEERARRLGYVQEGGVKKKEGKGKKDKKDKKVGGGRAGWVGVQGCAVPSPPAQRRLSHAVADVPGHRCRSGRTRAKTRRTRRRWVTGKEGDWEGGCLEGCAQLGDVGAREGAFIEQAHVVRVGHEACAWDTRLLPAGLPPGGWGLDREQHARSAEPAATRAPPSSRPAALIRLPCPPPAEAQAQQQGQEEQEEEAAAQQQQRLQRLQRQRLGLRGGCGGARRCMLAGLSPGPPTAPLCLCFVL